MLLNEKEAKLMYVILFGLVFVTTLVILIFKYAWVRIEKKNQGYGRGSYREECNCPDCRGFREGFE